jgi:hypothetical protein
MWTVEFAIVARLEAYYRRIANSPSHACFIAPTFRLLPALRAGLFQS